MRYFILISFSLFYITLTAQDSASIDKNHFEIGVKYLNQGKYSEAEKEFLILLESKQKLPSELAFFFGRNSYHLNKYRQATSWLNKYLQLKGPKGIHYEAALEYLSLSEEELIAENKRKREDLENALSTGETYDCGGLDKMICPVCHGNGVIIKRGYFDNIYQMCPYSLGESFITCDEYNLFIKGELKPKTVNSSDINQN